MSEEWGPWVDHDGKGFPKMLDGKYINAEGETVSGKPLCNFGVGRASMCKRSWDWQFFGELDPKKGWINSRVLRYRIRKPKGLTILEGLLTDLPEEVGA